MVLSEVLDAINEDPSLLQQGKPFGFRPHSALAQVFACSFLPQYKFKLPDGDPPYNDEKREPGMTSSDLLYAIRHNRFAYFLDDSIRPSKREQLFIMLLETVCTSEAKVLLAIKDQTLDLMYPNITYKILEDAGYLPPMTEEEIAKANSKSKQDSRTEVSHESTASDKPAKTRSKSSTSRRSTSGATKRTPARKTKENVDNTNAS